MYKLLHELLEDNASILVDPNLIGDYNVISKRKADRRNNKIQTDSWSKIFGLTKNKTRANISISYNAKTIVQIPNNPYNIIPGGREIDVKKSICIIKDGRLNQERIGIKASPKLIGKLKKIYEKDYKVGLTNDIDPDTPLYPVIKSMFDENVFLYYEEKVLGRKLRDMGLKTVLVTDTFYVHAHSVSIDKTVGKILAKQKILHKSKLYYYKTYLGAGMIKLTAARAFLRLVLAEAWLLSGGWRK